MKTLSLDQLGSVTGGFWRSNPPISIKLSPEFVLPPNAGGANARVISVTPKR